MFPAPRALQRTEDSSPNSSLQRLDYTSYSPRYICRTQRTRKFISEISVRKTGDILKPQCGFRQCYGTLKTVKKDEEPDGGEDEEEDRDKHPPALRDLHNNISECYQDLPNIWGETERDRERETEKRRETESEGMF